jgi:predicted metal-dependent phosphoesterase TrpH
MLDGLIDLHLHPTASDGLWQPAVLVDMAWRAGIRTMSVTDHDTVAGLDEAERAAVGCGMAFVPGIEITAVHQSRDVHVLGYYVDRQNAAFRTFLERQREDRLRRAAAIADRLEEIGKPIDRETLLTSRGGGRSLGRPMIARALVRAGHVADARQAFDELIGEGKPAFMPRTGPGPREVIANISRAGGLSSLAHPGLLKRDDLIAHMVDAGLSALEAYHSDHDPAMIEHYLALANRYGVAVTGGSDYHGDEGRRKAAFGKVALPASHFSALAARVEKKET